MIKKVVSSISVCVEPFAYIKEVPTQETQENCPYNLKVVNYWTQNLLMRIDTGLKV